MNLNRWARAAVTLTATVFLIVGCAKSDDHGGKKEPTKKDGQVAEKKDTKHDEWWCAEHGIPEEECSKCSSKLGKEHKAKGDWCKEHDIAKSQCFACDPALWDKYKAKYKAKYGQDKEPPEPTDNMPKK